MYGKLLACVAITLEKRSIEKLHYRMLDSLVLFNLQNNFPKTNHASSNTCWR
jgi:hypothetical protein